MSYKSKYTGEQMDSFFDIIESKKDVIERLSVSENDELLFDGMKVALEGLSTEEETVEVE